MSLALLWMLGSLASIASAATETYSLQTVVGGALPDNIQALSANLGQIDGIAVDRAGNVYMSLVQYSAVVRMDTTGLLTVVAGNGTSGYSGDGGSATKAQLSQPFGLAIDSAGNLYIADYFNYRIRKVAGGIITTVAGNGDPSPGDSDNGPATDGRLYLPSGVAFDSSGNLYITESGHGRVRKVSNGIITTVAGTGLPGFSGDGGPATLAQLSSPNRVALDAAGNLYISDAGNTRIRKVSNGTISTVAGPGLFSLQAIFLDSAGNLYRVQDYQISEQTDCCITDIAGKYSLGTFTGDGGPANEANLGLAVDAAFDSSGNLYIADSGAECLRKVTQGVIDTVAGHGSGGDGGAARYSEILPQGIAVDRDGALYVAESLGNRIRKIFKGSVTTFAGNGIPGFSGDGGPASDAQLSNPTAVAVDAAGAVYIVDTYNERIRKVSNGVITTIAGDGNADFAGDNKPAATAELYLPNKVTVGADGSVYIIDGDASRVRKISGGLITGVAGNGVLGDSGDNGPATSAQIYATGIAVDARGNVYLSGSNRIRVVSNGIISTFAGTGTFGFGGDGGPALNAQFGQTQGLTLDSLGNLYVGDPYNHRIRKIAKGIVNTIAGDGTAAIYDGTGPVNFTPLELGIDPLGNIYFSDSLHRVIRSAACLISIDASSATFTKFGGTLVVNILGPSGCAWAVQNVPSWLTVSGSGSGIAPGTLSLVAGPNPGRPQIATLQIGASMLTVTQTDVGCSYSIEPTGQAFPASPSSATISVETEVGCPWSVTGAPPWVALTNSATGTGNSIVQYQVSPNTGAGRAAAFSVANINFDVEQQAATLSGLSFVGSMPHIAAEENWITTFTFVNKGTAPTQARFSLFGDSGIPLEIPLSFPQQPGPPLLGASIDRALLSNASIIIQTAGPQSVPVETGSAQLAGTGPVDGFAIFHLIPGAQEAAVPMETRNAGAYILAFDNTGGVVLGVAIANVSSGVGTVGIVLRDDTGNQIGTGSLPIQASGHISFVLSAQYPVTANRRGTIEFDTPPGGQISVLGIRTTPLGTSTTVTTIPALANVGTRGGSIAHIATGNGWQTTFVLVNTGTSTAQVNLNFFADVTGVPLSLPISFPQLGSTVTTASAVNQALAAGAALLIQSTAPPSNPTPTTGSAELTTNGNVGGFVIFRYNPNGQEAVVPLESRTANGFIIAFDNTAGTATGIALNSVSSQSINVPVIVRDDTGAQIATDMLSLAANGHLAFTLATDKYPQTNNIRGTIEFDTPTGGQIGVLGIRIPIGHTFTTLPALVK